MSDAPPLMLSAPVHVVGAAPLTVKVAILPLAPVRLSGGAGGVDELVGRQHGRAGQHAVAEVDRSVVGQRSRDMQSAAAGIVEAVELVLVDAEQAA